jgi:hypothetical protein
MFPPMLWLQHKPLQGLWLFLLLFLFLFLLPVSLWKSLVKNLLDTVLPHCTGSERMMGTISRAGDISGDRSI